MCLDAQSINVTVIKQFKNSPAYEPSYEHQKKCLETGHENSNGKDGLVGYEILSCGIVEDRY
ncbi:MAG TPA: hypothetical protein VLD84_04465 [Nitrososphaeraceae archaeon]|nr:hypothetical protein [Nitrososphaeraceae archaeon]